MPSLVQQIYWTSIPISNVSLNNHKTPRKSLVKVCAKPTSLHEAILSLSTDSTKCLDEVYSLSLDLCTAQKTLSHGKEIHANILKCHNVYDGPFLNTKLVVMYGKCGSLVDAEEVFHAILDRSVFSYNAMLGAYALNGKPNAVIDLYAKMRFTDVLVDAHTFSIVLKACAGLKNVYCGREIHGLGVKFGISYNDIFVNSLMNMYTKCNDLDSVVVLYNGMVGEEDVVLWNLMISAYSINNMTTEALLLFMEMLNAGLTPTTFTFVAALQACEELLLGMQLHTMVFKLGLWFDCYVANALVLLYSKFCRMDEATIVFSKIRVKDGVSWNSMLSCYVQNGLYGKAFELFHQMTRLGRPPDHVSVISLLSACGRSKNLMNGMEIHAFIMKNGIELDLQVANSLIDMYAKCSKTSFMRAAFHRICYKDHISWTTIVSGYVQNYCYEKALQTFRLAQAECVYVGRMMIESILQTCHWSKSILAVKEIHGFVVRRELQDIVLQNTLIDVYGETGKVYYAKHAFGLIKAKNIVSWTSMIACCFHNGLVNEALELSFRMVRADVELDSIAILHMLLIVASLSTLRTGKEIHGYLLRNCFNVEGPIASSLIDMYASCGAIDYSCKVFRSANSKDLVVWTNMINAYGMHGQGMMAVNLFSRMEALNIHPDHVVFLALLHACSHSALVSEGKQFFQLMQHDYYLEPWPEHYACLVDLLGRANYLEEAFELAKNMRLASVAAVWCALLGACLTHRNIVVGEIAAKKLLEIEPDNAGNYVLVSNLFAAVGRWEDVQKVRIKMKLRGLKKDPGCSWITVETKVHTFMSGDRSHPNSGEIYQKLSQITENLKREGHYDPQSKHVLHNVDEKEKLMILYSHSERLAIAYGLLSTPPSEPIRVTKNLRVCCDCHTFTKLVSEFCEREIIVRDANRFHHFKDGACSCRDFW